MDKELEWLKDNMPKGWEIYQSGVDEDQWRLVDREYEHMPYKMYPRDGDIGLAPLTSLLKQELGKKAEYVSNIEFYRKSDGGMEWKVIIGDDDIQCRGVYSLEFKAVVAAYREQR